jgi:hypothetical protein|nr:hypothetical protein [Brucella anthropi]
MAKGTFAKAMPHVFSEEGSHNLNRKMLIDNTEEKSAKLYPWAA